MIKKAKAIVADEKPLDSFTPRDRKQLDEALSDQKLTAEDRRALENLLAKEDRHQLAALAPVLEKTLSGEQPVAELPKALLATIETLAEKESLNDEEKQPLRDVLLLVKAPELQARLREAGKLLADRPDLDRRSAAQLLTTMSQASEGGLGESAKAPLYQSIDWLKDVIVTDERQQLGDLLEKAEALQAGTLQFEALSAEDRSRIRAGIDQAEALSRQLGREVLSEKEKESLEGIFTFARQHIIQTTGDLARKYLDGEITGADLPLEFYQRVPQLKNRPDVDKATRKALSDFEKTRHALQKLEEVPPNKVGRGGLPVEELAEVLAYLGRIKKNDAFLLANDVDTGRLWRFEKAGWLYLKIKGYQPQKPDQSDADRDK